MRIGVPISLALSLLAAPSAYAAGGASNPGTLVSFEHSLIVYAFAILISFGVAMTMKLLSSMLRKLRPSAE